jgi:hypothetical protein
LFRLQNIRNIYPDHILLFLTLTYLSRDYYASKVNVQDSDMFYGREEDLLLVIT